MTTKGQFNTKSPTIKRILKEASELASTPSPDLHAEPLEDNLFEWHFTLRGPPAPSPYASGIYHGRIVLPPQYPLRPPAFRFLTPTGRFEVNREICLSISGHHEETWQPAWGIRTAMVAIRSFMDTDAKGQLGGIECEAEARRKMAGESRAFTCGVCARSNESILREREEAAREVAGEKREEEVPAELRLAYRDELGKGEGEKGKENANSEAGADVKAGGKGKEKEVDAEPSAASSSSVPLTTSPPPVIPAPNRTVPVQAQAPNPRSVRRESSLAWIDACIYGVLAALLFMLLRKVIL